MYTDPKQVLEYAVYIGIEALSEPYLLWIAEDGIQGELLCCSVLQCVAVCCCSVLVQCVAAQHTRPMGWLRLVGSLKL